MVVIIIRSSIVLAMTLVFVFTCPTANIPQSQDTKTYEQERHQKSSDEGENELTFDDVKFFFSDTKPTTLWSFLDQQGLQNAMDVTDDTEAFKLFTNWLVNDKLEQKSLLPLTLQMIINTDDFESCNLSSVLKNGIGRLDSTFIFTSIECKKEATPKITVIGVLSTVGTRKSHEARVITRAFEYKDGRWLEQPDGGG